MDNDPFGYPPKQYLWVILIACVGGLVKHMNSTKHFNWVRLVVDITTAGFTGVISFWACEAANIHGPMSAILIAVGGSMGNRAWSEFEALWKAKLGIKSDEAPK